VSRRLASPTGFDPNAGRQLLREKEFRVTVVVSVKINDGVVLAADSAGSMGSGQIYTPVNKVANLCEGLPVGVMSTGSGGIGERVSRDAAERLVPTLLGLGPSLPDWKVDPEGYTVGAVAQRLRQFMFVERAAVCEAQTNIQLRVATTRRPASAATL
jgi:hypothetical protein